MGASQITGMFPLSELTSKGLGFYKRCEVKGSETASQMNCDVSLEGRGHTYYSRVGRF